MAENTHSKEAKHDEKMIEIVVRFWTNDIAEIEGHIAPKNCWESGVITLSKNDTHGISAMKPLHFNSLADVPAVIQQMLSDASIKMHASNKLPSTTKEPRILGLHADRMQMSDDFDAPLPDEFWAGTL